MVNPPEAKDSTAQQPRPQPGGYPVSPAPTYCPAMRPQELRTIRNAFVFVVLVAAVLWIGTSMRVADTCDVTVRDVSTSLIAMGIFGVAIALVGVYTDTPQSGLQNMLVAHSNFGWMIFLGWIALFWAVVLRLMGSGGVPVPTAAKARKRGVLCGLCEDPLTPALPGYRCECGKFYHAACAATVEECPRCDRSLLGLREYGSTVAP